MRVWIDEYAGLDSPIHRLEPRLKLVALLGVMFAFSLVDDLRLVPVMLLITGALFMASRLPASFLWTRLRYPGFFLLVMAVILPLFAGTTVWLRVGPLAIRAEGVALLALVASRFVCILTVGLVLFGTAPFTTSIRAMRQLGLPALLADMMLLSFRYLFEFGAALSRMETAMRLRGFGGSRLSPRSLRTLAMLAGSLLVRSYEQAERVYVAMRLRGYGGDRARSRSGRRSGRGRAAEGGSFVDARGGRIHRSTPTDGEDSAPCKVSSTDSVSDNGKAHLSSVVRPRPSADSVNPSADDLARPSVTTGNGRDQTAQPGESTMLTVTDLHIAYPDQPPILSGVDLQIPPGQRVGVIGPNGAGKTTLFLTICGVLKPQCGTIRVNGNGVSYKRFRPDVGLVFQNPDDQLFSPSVGDDVAFGPQNMDLDAETVEARVQAALAITGVAHLRDRPPHHLSGGEKRMVAIASVLAMEPALILYDEPGANLDIRARRRMIHFLQTAPQTILLASHDLEMVLEVCERVVLLDEGRIVADGETQAVLGDAALMEAHGLEKPHSLLPHLQPHHVQTADSSALSSV